MYHRTHECAIGTMGHRAHLTRVSVTLCHTTHDEYVTATMCHITHDESDSHIMGHRTHECGTVTMGHGLHNETETYSLWVIQHTGVTSQNVLDKHKCDKLSQIMGVAQ